MQTIELLAAAVAEARGILSDRVKSMQDDLAAIKRKHLAGIRQAVNAAAGDTDRLRAAIEATPELFEKPRTRVLAGIRCGYMKQRGQVVIADEPKTIRFIREQLPKDQAELLIRVRESVDKQAVYDLSAGDLKRLGIAIEADSDAIVIKPADASLDKIVDGMLKDAEGVEQAA